MANLTPETLDSWRKDAAYNESGLDTSRRILALIAALRDEQQARKKAECELASYDADLATIESRDEWKARAEQAEQELFAVKAYAAELQDRAEQAETDADNGGLMRRGPYRCGRCGEPLAEHGSHLPGLFRCADGTDTPWAEFTSDTDAERAFSDLRAAVKAYATKMDRAPYDTHLFHGFVVAHDLRALVAKHRGAGEDRT